MGQPPPRHWLCSTNSPCFKIGYGCQRIITQKSRKPKEKNYIFGRGGTKYKTNYISFFDTDSVKRIALKRLPSGWLRR